MKTSQKVYFRRCHICDHVSRHKTADESELAACLQCDKLFVPFLFFDDKTTPIVADNEPRPDTQQSYLPIRGFTSYW